MATSYSTRLGNAPEEGIKAPVVVSTGTNITLSGEQTINSVAVTANQRVLVRAQTDNTENGIYVVSTGAWSRAKDFNNANDVVNGVLVLDTNSGALYRAVFSGSWSPGTTAITFSVQDTSTVQHEVILGSEFVARVGTLTGMSYKLGVNNLWGFRNGQFIFGGGVNYTETSETSITLTFDPNPSDRFDFFSNLTTTSTVSSASAITYTPSGTGAVATDVQTKLREFSVSPEDFGCVGDGATNDSVNFQKAVTAHKYIRLTPGKTYLLNSSITLNSETTIFCERGLATISCTSASSVNIFSGSSVTDIHFENIFFSMPVCNASLNITPISLTNVSRFSAHRCIMDNGYSLVYMFGGSDVYITECRANLPYSYGVILADDITRAWVLDGRYNGSIAHDGIKVAGSVTAEAPVHRDITIRGNVCYDNNRDGIDCAVNDGYRINIVDNILYNNTLTGIEFKLLDTDPVKLKRCRLSGNIIEVSTDSAVGITAICASATDVGKMENVSISNNQIECTSTNNDGIKITTLDQCFVKDNEITGGVNAINALGSRNTAINDNTADGQTNFLRLATDGTNANSGIKVLDNEARNLSSAFYAVIDSNTANIEHSNNVSDSPIDTMLGTGWSFRQGSGYVEAFTTGTKNLYASSHGTHYTNNGATGNTLFNINHTYIGMEYTFTQTNVGSYNMTISPSAGVTIGGGGTAKDMYLNTNNGSVTIRAISTTKWEIVADSGVTITYEP